jgi:2-desacetyl-2-hydroxyethyl bacteriochlorophyllide A dehydrogenase
MATLRQCVIFTAPRRVEVIEERLPPPAPGQVRVESIVAAISPGTEMLFYRGDFPTETADDSAVDATIAAAGGATLRYPLRYGYANVGRVVELGDGVERSWLDRLVFAFVPHASAFLAAPSELLLVPDDIAPEQAALLPNMETAVNFVMDGQPLIGERVAVVGLGIVGLLTTALLSRFPLAALTAIEPLPLRRSLARAWGATALCAPDDLAAVAPADLTYELSGSPAALDTAIAVTGFSGRIVVGSWYGAKRAPIDLGGRFHRSRLRLVSSQVSTIDPALSGRWDKARRFAVAWEMLRTLDASPLVTHRFRLADAAAAYRQIDRDPAATLQVFLES